MQTMDNEKAEGVFAGTETKPAAENVAMEGGVQNEAQSPETQEASPKRRRKKLDGGQPLESPENGQGGLSLKEIQMYLGHGQLSTTADIYTHLDYSHQQKSSDLASQIIGQIRASIPVAP